MCIVKIILPQPFFLISFFFVICIYTSFSFISIQLYIFFIMSRLPFTTINSCTTLCIQLQPSHRTWLIKKKKKIFLRNAPCLLRRVWCVRGRQVYLYYLNLNKGTRARKNCKNYNRRGIKENRDFCLYKDDYFFFAFTCTGR